MEPDEAIITNQHQKAVIIVAEMMNTRFVPYAR